MRSHAFMNSASPTEAWVLFTASNNVERQSTDKKRLIY